MKKLTIFFGSCAAVFLIGLIMLIVGINAGGVDGMHAVANDHDWVSDGPGAQATVEMKDLEYDSIESTGVTDIVIVGENSYDKIISDYHLETAVDPEPGMVVAVFGSNTVPPEFKVEGKTLKIEGGSHEEFTGINLDLSAENVYPTVIAFCSDKELDQIKISSAFSDVELRDISFKNAEIGLNFGDIEAGNIVSQGIKINADSGDVDLSGELKGTTNVKVEEGDIEIDTKDVLKAYTMKIKTLAGDINIGEKEIEYIDADEEGYSYTKEGSKYTLLLETISGDIDVNQIRQ